MYSIVFFLGCLFSPNNLVYVDKVKLKTNLCSKASSQLYKPSYDIIYPMEELFEQGDNNIYLRGDSIDINSNVHYIKSGLVGLFSGKDSETLIFVFRESEFFPLQHNGRNFLAGDNIEYRALSTATILSISSRQFTDKAFSPQFARLSFEAAANMLETLLERIDSLSHYSVRERIIRRLLFIADRVGKVSGDKVIIDFPMPHSDMAAAVNTSRESANRTMKQLERGGYIVLRNQAVIINSMKKLQSLLGPETPKNRNGAKVAAGLAAESLLLLNDQLTSLVG